jgi:hypothetical protein
MKIISCVGFCIMFLAEGIIWATQVPGRDLFSLLEEADHVLICKVEKVQMVNEDGQEILDEKASTGPGVPNQLLLHLVVAENGVLKTNAKQIPDKRILPLWKRWHDTLKYCIERYEGKEFIFLLKGEDFQWVYPAGFSRRLSERSDIEKILQAQSCLAIKAQEEPLGEWASFGVWMEMSDMDEALKKMKTNQYPIVIQAGYVLGDGILFRVLCVPKPNKDFEYEIAYGKDEEEFRQLHDAYTKRGFRLISHQTTPWLAGISHQAVWVK